MLKSWLLYHGQLLGFENLYVIDASTNPKCFSFLRYARDVLGANILFNCNESYHQSHSSCRPHRNPNRCGYEVTEVIEGDKGTEGTFPEGDKGANSVEGTKNVKGTEGVEGTEGGEE